MRFESNGINEIFFVDGAERSLSKAHCDALTSAAAHFIECFNITHEVDVYVSQRSVIQKMGSQSRAWIQPPTFDRGNSIVGVYVDPDSDVKDMILSLAHEMIHAWQVSRGDLVGSAWKGTDFGQFPYALQPWEIEAFGNMEKVAESFFRSRRLSASELQTMRNQTDLILKEMQKDISAAAFKEKFKKVAKVAAGLGLAALVGM